MPTARAGKLSKHFTIPVNNSGDGNVLNIGRGVSVYCDLQPPNNWPEHQHPTAQIVVALDPVEAVMKWSHAGCILSEASTVPHVWIVPPDTPHSVEWKGTAAMLVLYVECSYIREECGCDLADGALLSLALLARQDYLVTCLCRKFHDFCHRKRSLSGLLAVAGGTLLAALLLKAHFLRAARPFQRRGLGEKRLQCVTVYIDAHLRDPLSPALLAQVSGLTEYHFSRMFKVSTGMPPMKYVWRCRIHRARQLLETGEWKVVTAALETGFCDQSHLDRQFRREFGCSPGSVIPRPGAS
jgi:AraC family transcriptional regulator